MKATAKEPRYMFRTMNESRCSKRSTAILITSYSMIRDVFFAECQLAGLPTIPIVADFEGGEAKRWAKASVRSCRKLTCCKAGPWEMRHRSDAIYVRAAGFYRCSDGTLKTAEELLKSLAETSRTHPYILQERYVNHPEIAALSPGALCTFRIVTCRLPDGQCEDIIAIFKMPTGNCFADNFSIGGIAISIDKK